jgi:EAL domain-containing protein (putative c-di-GMP-specific phosphodiesterase class I)
MTPVLEMDLEMDLQPIVDLTSGRVVGVESLARFADRRPPDEHFAEARTRNGRLALELAAVRAGLARIGELPGDAYLTVNVSPETAATREFAVLLDDAPAARVVLELTEHAPVGDYETLETALAGLRARGMRVAIDDAGAGFASMRHVLALRPDVIKLDISITRGIDADPQRREFVRALVQFAHATGCSLVAEGIETREELAAVRSLGVACGQGFWLGRPERSATGPWQLSLPPIRRARSARKARGGFGRVARSVGVVLAAALAYPSVVAVAGLKAPSQGEPIPSPPAVVRTEHGGSARVPASAHRPAPAPIVSRESRAKTVATVVPAVAAPAPAPSATVTDSPVQTTVEVVGGVVGGVLDAAGNTVNGVTKALGGLLGG